MVKRTEGPYWYQLSEAQRRAVYLNAELAREIFKYPVFSASGGSWRWHSYRHNASGAGIKVDLLDGEAHYFCYGCVTESGLRSVTIPLDIFSDETIAQTKWKPAPTRDDAGPPRVEQLQFAL